MKKIQNFALVLALYLIIASPVAAITIKLASPAPQASPWGRAIAQIAARWNQETNGGVTLRVFHNAVAGSGDDVIRKIRINQLQAAVLTSNGLNLLSDGVLTYSAPGLIRSDEEVEYVFERIEPTLSSTINSGRMKILGWSKPGWVYLFTKGAVNNPEALKRYRLSAFPELASSLQKFGYNAVSLPLSEWLTGLNSGLIDGIFSSPVAAAGFQWFGIASSMLNLRLAPFLAGFVVSDRAWNRVPDDQKAILMEIVQEEIGKLDIESQKLEQQAIETMQSFGLELVSLNRGQREQWTDFFEEVNTQVLGNTYNEEIYIQIQDILKDFRE